MMDINHPRKSGPRPYFRKHPVPNLPQRFTGILSWTASMLAILSLVISTFGMSFAPANAVDGPYNGVIISYDGKGDDPHKVEICHAPPGLEGTKYNDITVDASSIVKNEGHDGHEFDIIPPFEYYTDKNNTDTAIYPGKNWTTDNEAIWTNHCAVPGQPQNDTATVTIVKYINGSMATANSANSLAFTMNASWYATNIGSGSGSFDLDADGFNGGPAYSATTADMSLGASYTASEMMNNNVGATCDAGKPFALSGYRVGSSLSDAENNALSSTVPNLTNIQSNQFIIVNNISCSMVAPQTVTVTIAKFLNGQMATAQSADSTAFPMHASWNDPTGIGTSSGDFTLSPTGFNNANAYQATTSDMQLGADYSTNEVMGDTVGATCDAGKPYALSGYSTGDSLAAAIAGTVTTTSPNFTNLQANKFVVVHNIKCGSVLGENDTTLHFIKVVCDQFSDVAGNENGANADASGGNFTQFSNYNNGAFTPSPLVNGEVNPSEIPSSNSGCNRATGYQFELSSDQAQTADLMTTTATSGTSSDAEFSINASNLPAALQAAINSGQLWVSEITQSGASFAALRCYNDALNGDNLEVISLNGQHPTDVYCIAYNISTPSPAPCQLTTATLNSSSATLFKGLTTTQAVPESNDSAYTGGGANAVATNPDGFPGAWDTSINDPNLAGSIWVSDAVASPTNNNGGQNDAWRLFSQSVTIPAGASDITADLYFTGDNSVVAYLNNNLIGTAADFSTVTHVGSLSLVPGANEFEFAVKNDAFGGATNPTGIIYRVNISYCPTTPSGGGGSGGNSGGGGGGGTPVSNLISGIKYNDLNFNGTRDSGEPALSGWVIYLDLNNNNVRDSGEPFQTTDVNGAYSFVNLNPATYTVREEMQTGWSQFQPGVSAGEEYAITVTATSNNTNVNFGNAQGQVLGETTDIPSNSSSTTTAAAPQVLGESTSELPRTGMDLTWLIILGSIAAYAAVYASKRSESPKK